MQKDNLANVYIIQNKCQEILKIMDSIFRKSGLNFGHSLPDIRSNCETVLIQFSQCSVSMRRFPSRFPQRSAKIHQMEI